MMITFKTNRRYGKYLFFLVICHFIWITSNSQTIANLVPPSNGNYSGLEKNILFYATTRYQVSQTGTMQLNLANLFDGNYAPSYTSQAIDPGNPTTITISNLPNIHTQNGAYVGWATRGYPAKRFKIEGYNAYGSSPGWVVVADIDNNNAYTYMIKIPSGAYTQLRYTFYEGNITGGGKLGISELFFLHNEAAQAYEGLLVKYQSNGNVLLGKTSQANSSYKLDVNGNIRANKVVVNTTGADYVFDSSNHLMAIDSLKEYIDKYHHLPGVPTAEQMRKNGLDVGEAFARLLEKMEEMTKYLIMQQHIIHQQQKAIDKLKNAF